jgi:hypothetical protein
MCIGHGNLLFIHGGRNNFVLEDLHVLDFVNKSWTEISSVGRMPPPRHSHLLTMHKVGVVGGGRRKRRSWGGEGAWRLLDE